MKCEACGGSGVKLVEGSGDLFMEACPACSTTGLKKDLGFWFDCGWSPNGASPPGLEPWRVRIVEEIGGVVTLRPLQPVQLRQLHDLIKEPFQKNLVTVISELAKTRRELEDTKARLERLERKLESFPQPRSTPPGAAIEPPPPRSLMDRIVSKLMGV